VSDVGEWATGSDIEQAARKVKEALREGRPDLADHWADKVIELARKLRTIDVRENRNHRKLVVTGAKCVPARKASTRAFDAPPVLSQAEYGAQGAAVVHEMYSREQFRRWGRMGGRPRNRTLAEIEATTGSRGNATSERPRRASARHQPQGAAGGAA